jgi:hypothetical protein
MYKMLVENKSLIYYTGSIWKTKQHGNVSIIGRSAEYRVNKKGNKYYPLYIVEFEDATQVQAWNSAIQKGLVKNPNTPTLHGRGYLGVGPYKSRVGYKLTWEYNCWSHMLRYTTIEGV